MTGLIELAYLLMSRLEAINRLSRPNQPLAGCYVAMASIQLAWFSLSAQWI